MTVLSDKSLRGLVNFGTGDHILEPFVERTLHEPTGTSYGLSMCGYDVRLDQEVVLEATGRVDSFVLASTLEKFHMPDNVVGIVHDKSTWARRGIAVQNTVIEAGWCGYLTLELNNHSQDRIVLPEGTPIAQVIFHWIDQSCEAPYQGKYNNQARGPQPAIVETKS